MGVIINNKEYGRAYINGNIMNAAYINGDKVFSDKFDLRKNFYLRFFDANDNPAQGSVSPIYTWDTSNYLQYRISGGEWTNFASNTKLTSGSDGLIWFRGKNRTGLFNGTHNNYWILHDSYVRAYGNFSVLLDWDKDPLSITNINPAAFEDTFSRNAKILSADLNLVCTNNPLQYQGLFYQCTKLKSVKMNILTNAYTTAFSYFIYNENTTPSIEEITITTNGNVMDGTSIFEIFAPYQTTLKKIIVDWKTWPTGNRATVDWLYGVASTGTFYCPSALTIPSRNQHGVPAGWTIVNTD